MSSIAWEEPIREWLGDRTDVSVAEVLQHVFGIAKEQSQSAQTRVARILTQRLGFKQASAANTGRTRESLLARTIPQKKVTVSSVTGMTVDRSHWSHWFAQQKMKERRHDSAGPRAGALRGRGRRR